MSDEINNEQRGLTSPDKKLRGYRVYERADIPVPHTKKRSAAHKPAKKASLSPDHDKSLEQARVLAEIKQMVDGMQRYDEYVRTKNEEQDEAEKRFARATQRGASPPSRTKLPGMGDYNVMIGQLEEAGQTGHIKVLKEGIEGVASELAHHYLAAVAVPLLATLGKGAYGFLSSKINKISGVYGALSKSAIKVIESNGKPVSVYFSVDKNNYIRYIGISDNPVYRQFRHLKIDPTRQINIFLTVGTRDEARGVEELLIRRYGLSRMPKGVLDNKIHSVDIRNAKEYKRITDLGRKILRDYGFTDF